MEAEQSREPVRDRSGKTETERKGLTGTLGQALQSLLPLI